MDAQKQKGTINFLYAMLIVSAVTSFVPNAFAQILSLVLLTVTLVSAYIYRSKDEEHGLVANHMTYLIGTIWISTGFAFIGMIAAIAVVYFYGDHTIIHTMMADYNNGAVPTEAGMEAMMMNYMTANQGLLITTSLATIGPAILYFIYRVANGLSRAAKGYRIAKPHSWL